MSTREHETLSDVTQGKRSLMRSQKNVCQIIQSLNKTPQQQGSQAMPRLYNDFLRLNQHKDTATDHAKQQLFEDRHPIAEKRLVN